MYGAIKSTDTEALVITQIIIIIDEQLKKKIPQSYHKFIDLTRDKQNNISHGQLHNFHFINHHPLLSIYMADKINSY